MSVINTPLEFTYVKTNGIKLHVVQAGPKDGPLVIMLHGFPEFWYGWRHQIDHLVNLGFRLMIPDQRGYNLSEKVQGGIDNYIVNHMAADAIGLINAAGRDTAYVVGHDWGALVSWWTTLLHPEKVTKLAILEVPHPYIFDQALQDDPRQIRMSWYAWLFQMYWIPEHVMAINDWDVAVWSIKSSGKPTTFTAEDLEIYRNAYRQPEAMTCSMNYYRALIQRPRPIPKDWRIHCPVQMFWGEKDQYLDERLVKPSLRMCDNAKIDYVSYATHWIQHDAAPDVNRILGEFLTS